MTYVLGYQRNKYLVFGLILALFFSSIYGLLYLHVTVAGFLFIWSGVGALMILVKELNGRVDE